MSRHYYEHNRIDLGRCMEDGFRDAGPGVEPSSAGSSLVLDRRRDPALEGFIDRCRKKLRKAKDEATQAMVLALLVSDTCGRSGAHALDLAARHARLAREHRDGNTGEVLLGDLTGDRVSERRGRGKVPPTGAALVPQRALLYKAASDWLGLMDCTLERRPASTNDKVQTIMMAASWNVVMLSSSPHIVDLLFDPGALYEEHSQKASEYRRLLTEVESLHAAGERASTALQAPSSRKELNGHMPRPPWHVEPWELDIMRAERIGRGGFGEVFHGRWAGVHVAVKEIKDTNPTDAEVVDFMLEIALLSTLNHPNIVRFWRGCSEMRSGGRSLLMVTEYVRQGGLSRLLHGHDGPALPEPLTLPQALVLALDIARGVQYLHSQRILHLDLKSPNVLVARPWTAKLCDFGLAKIRGEHTMVQSTLQGVSPVWAPPEMFDDKDAGLTEKADVYSFAIIYFELLTKRVPFQECSSMQLPALKLQGQLPQIPVQVPEDCAALVRQCCAAKPPSRPSMSGVVARLKEIAQSRGLQLADVKPPVALLREADSQERLAKEREDVAAQKLVELDGQRAQLRTELNQLQQKLEAVRRHAAELAAATSGGGSGGSGGSPQPDASGPDDSWCESFVREVAGSRFRCTICSKLFRGPDFVKRHVLAKHYAEVRRAAEDAYFDCDVSREDTMPGHKSLRARTSSEGLGKPSAAAVVPGCFSQALQDASERGDQAYMSELLKLRANPAQQDDGGTGPVLLAAKAGHVAVLEMLLSAAETATTGAAVGLVQHASGAGLTPLHMASSEGHCEVIAALLQRGAFVDAPCARGKTALLHAGENGHGPACELLVRAKADHASKTKEGETLLHVAARFGDADLIAQIVALRANLLAHDQDGWTPLHEAAHWGAAAVEALCRAGANVHARSGDGETPLHVALEGYEQTEACEVLLRWRADPAAADVDGESPLHVAARRGNCGACGALLVSRAQATIADNAGRTPLDLARSEDVKGLLERSLQAAA